MNYFDYQIISYLNQFARHSDMFDNFVVLLAHSSMLKGGVLITLIWWAWFRNEDRHSRDREHILLTLLSCMVALVLGRGLALMLPFRIRPLHEESLHFLLPNGQEPTTLEGWSSFPSDHAVLFFTLATGLLFISRKAGVFALFYVTLFIAIPRMYLGLHYPTDLIAGAILGIAIALAGNIYFVMNKNIRLITDWSYSKPQLFYPLFFLSTCEMVNMFIDSRDLIEYVSNLIQSIIA